MREREYMLAGICSVLLVLVATSFAGGTIDKVSGWCEVGTVLEVNAAPDNFSRFEGWVGDTNGCTEVNRQITIPVSDTRSISAEFLLKKAPKGTSEAWLAAYELTNATPDAAELLDPDNDGALTWEEYVAGTDPTNSADRFEVKISSPSSLPEVSFETRTTATNYYGALTRHYSLIGDGDMLNTNWVVVAGCADFPATGGTRVFTNSAVGNMYYYRAKVWLE